MTWTYPCRTSATATVSVTGTGLAWIRRCYIVVPACHNYEVLHRGLCPLPATPKGAHTGQPCQVGKLGSSLPNWSECMHYSVLYVCVCMCVFVPLLCSIDKGVLAIRKFERIKLRSSKVLKKLWRLRMSPGQMHTKSTGHTRGCQCAHCEGTAVLFE